MTDQEETTRPPVGVNEPGSVYEFDVTPGHESSTTTFRWGGRETLVSSIPIETPSQPYASIKYCVSGAGLLEWENDRWEIGPGMVFWAGAKNANTLTARPCGMENFAIFLGGKETGRLIEQFLRSPVGISKLHDPHVVESIFIDLMEEGLSTAQHREENSVLLTRVLLRRIEAQSSSRVPTNALARQTFKRCREYIARNFMQLTSLGEVAERCDVTVPYLCRLFDQFFDCSPYDYMTRLKMSRAENLLLRPHSPIHEVAVAVGYKDARLFARNFKAIYGKSPTQYRHVHAVALEE